MSPSRNLGELKQHRSASRVISTVDSPIAFCATIEIIPDPKTGERTYLAYSYLDSEFAYRNFFFGDATLLVVDGRTGKEVDGNRGHVERRQNGGGGRASSALRSSANLRPPSLAPFLSSRLVLLPIFLLRFAQIRGRAPAVFRGREKKRGRNRRREKANISSLRGTGGRGWAPPSLIVNPLLRTARVPVAAPVPTRRANEVEKIKAAAGDH